MRVAIISFRPLRIFHLQ